MTTLHSFNLEFVLTIKLTSLCFLFFCVFSFFFRSLHWIAQNALKKHGESASKSDHVAYDQGGHGGGYQRSIDITDFRDMPPEWQTSMPATFDEHDINEQ